MLRAYAGIGSRKTPGPVLETMERLAYELAVKGWTLRIGGAKGADTAFFDGANRAKGSTVIFLPKQADTHPEWWPVAIKHHPSWRALNPFAQRLIVRNTPIILSADLSSPSRFVICWTPDGKASGYPVGLRIAAAYGIPIYNLALDSTGAGFWDWLAFFPDLELADARSGGAP